jgi:hypothetical protein
MGLYALAWVGQQASFGLEADARLEGITSGVGHSV